MRNTKAPAILPPRGHCEKATIYQNSRPTPARSPGRDIATEQLASNLEQLARQKAKDQRPPKKFDYGNPMEYISTIRCFERAVDLPGLTAHSKLIELLH